MSFLLHQEPKQAKTVAPAKEASNGKKAAPAKKPSNAKQTVEKVGWLYPIACLFGIVALPLAIYWCWICTHFNNGKAYTLAEQGEKCIILAP